MGAVITRNKSVKEIPLIWSALLTIIRKQV